MKKQLLEKYWKGETSPEEEAWLKNNTTSLDKTASKGELDYFDQLNQFAEVSMDQAIDMDEIEKGGPQAEVVKSGSLFRNFRRIAAAILVIVAVGFAGNSFLNQQPEPLLVEENQEEAYELARQSLLLISAKLNKGIDCAKPLDKFNEAHAKISAKRNGIQE